MLDVGGERYLPVSFSDYSGQADYAGVVLSVMNYNASVIQPLSKTVALNADGQGELLVKGVGVGQSEIVMSDKIGDEGEATIGTTAPHVVSSGHVTEGGTYNSSNMPGFTFTAAYPSITPIVVNYTTAGSTLPGGLMPQLTGSVILPAGAGPTLFLPFVPTNDGKIAPDREAVLTTIVPGQVTYPYGGGNGNSIVAVMVVQDPNTPIIKMNGVVDNAVIQLDPQGDNTKLTDISMTIPGFDQSLISTTLTWLPNNFTIWLGPKVGPAGTNLGAGPSPARFTNPYTGAISYTWPGAPPKNVYGQDLDGSSNWDSTSVELAADVNVAMTPVAPASIGYVGSNANGTARGVVITGTGITTGGQVPKIVIGERMLLSAQWEGPGQPADNSTVNWSVPGKITYGFYSVTEVGSTTKGSGGPLLFDDFNVPYIQNGRLNQISFIWWKAPTSGEIDKVICTLQQHSASQNFNVASPEAVVKTTTNPNSGAVQKNGTYVTSGDDNGNPAITFAAYAKEPQNRSGGTYQWVQTIYLDVEQTNSLFGFVIDRKSDVYSDALDGGWPYNPHSENVEKWILGSGGYSDALNLVKTTEDSAGVQLNAQACTEKFQALMTLMYQPAGGGALDWVPLQSVPWTWNMSEIDGHIIHIQLKSTGSIPSYYPSWSSIKPFIP